MLRDNCSESKQIFWTFELFSVDNATDYGISNWSPIYAYFILFYGALSLCLVRLLCVNKRFFPKCGVFQRESHYSGDNFCD